jgi:hypothetical protein
MLNLFQHLVLPKADPETIRRVGQGDNFIFI